MDPAERTPVIPNGLHPAEIARRLGALRLGESVAWGRPDEPAGPPCPASVLVPLIRDDGAWRLLFIRRAEQALDRHSGEVAFPGGRARGSDRDAVATALREAREEIGLDPRAVEVLGVLQPLRTVSNFLVTPVVGHIAWPQSLRPDPREVAAVFSLSLDWLSDPRNRQARVWPSADHPQAREVIFFEEWEGHRLWGISASITLDFLRCIGCARTM